MIIGSENKRQDKGLTHSLLFRVFLGVITSYKFFIELILLNPEIRNAQLEVQEPLIMITNKLLTYYEQD